MNDAQIEKIKRFINDPLMNSAVKGIIQESFMKVNPKEDVHVLAAHHIAVGLLEEAWKSLEKYQRVEEEEQSKPTTLHV